MKTVYEKSAKKSSKKNGERVKKWNSEKQGFEARVEMSVPIDLAMDMEEFRETVYAHAQELGLKMMQMMMEEEVKQYAGQRYKRDKERQASRWAMERGMVRWNGNRTPIERPRVRSKTGKEIRLKSYEVFQAKAQTAKEVARRMLAGISAHKYESAMSDMLNGYGMKRSSVSRKFIKASAEKLRELNERRLEDLNLLVIMIDGIEFGRQMLTAAIGVDLDGNKHVLGQIQGDTETAELCVSLINNLVDRGLDVNKEYLFVVDGSKALSKALKKVFGESALIQRCQIHKRRNVKVHLPEKYKNIIDTRLKVAYGMKDYDEAKELLDKTVKMLDEINPSAANSLREGLEETLTLHKLNVPPVLRKSLSNTNIIESAFSGVRGIAGRVKRWQKGDHVSRWGAAGLLEIEQHFHKISGYRALPVLELALKTYQEKNKKCVDNKSEAV